MNTEKKNLKLEDPGQTHQNHGIAFLSFTNKPTPEIIFSWVTISFGLLKMNQTERKDLVGFLDDHHLAMPGARGRLHQLKLKKMPG